MTEENRPLQQVAHQVAVLEASLSTMSDPSVVRRLVEQSIAAGADTLVVDPNAALVAALDGEALARLGVSLKTPDGQARPLADIMADAERRKQELDASVQVAARADYLKMKARAMKLLKSGHYSYPAAEAGALRITGSGAVYVDVRSAKGKSLGWRRVKGQAAQAALELFEQQQAAAAIQEKLTGAV